MWGKETKQEQEKMVSDKDKLAETLMENQWERKEKI